MSDSKTKQYTTIKVSKKTHERLNNFRRKDETYDTVIQNLLYYYEIVIQSREPAKNEV